MTSFGLVRLKTIQDMLDACAPGWKADDSDHNWIVTYKGKTFERLPLGKHGRRTNPEVKLGYARKLATFFDLVKECVEANVPQLRGKVQSLRSSKKAPTPKS